MKEAIQKAIEGGWGGKLRPDVIITMLPHDLVGFHYPESFDGVEMSLWDIFHQPLFWQSIVKSCYRGSKLSPESILGVALVWNKEFIEHTHDGKEAEEFFNELLTLQK